MLSRSDSNKLTGGLENVSCGIYKPGDSAPGRMQLAMCVMAAV